MTTPEADSSDRSSLPVSRASHERTKAKASLSLADTTPSRPAASVVFMVLGLGGTAIGALSVIGAVVGEREIPMDAILMLVFGLVFFVASLQIGRRDSRIAQFIWHKGDGLAPLAESRGANATAMLAIPFVMLIAVMMQILIYDDIPILIPIAVGVLISVVVAASQVRSKVLVQSDSVLLGIPSGLMMGRLPFDMVHSIRLRGRFLRVVLKEKPNPLSSRSQRILILGNPVPIATAIQAIGVTHGYDFNVENVKFDAALLKSIMDAMQEEREGPWQTVGGRRVVDRRGRITEGTAYPDTVSILLAMAGASALFSIMVILAVDRAIADASGHHIAPLGCCYVIEMLFGVLILAGAVMARRRRRYKFVMASTVLAIINIAGVISVILGIVSLIMLRKCADEFND